MLDLKGGEIHEKVMNSIEKCFFLNGYENLPAVRMTLRKYKHLLVEMMYLTDDKKHDEETDSEDDGENDEVDSGNETGGESGE